MERNGRKDSLQPKLQNIKLDLNAYKILLHYQNHIEPLVIHFNKPARRFYFSLIALVVIEMKNLDKPKFIHIRKHERTLKLLDDALAGPNASKTSEGMWDKIRKAWRYTLPDLETGTHFKILNRDLIQPYERGGKHRYDCSDDEGDIWANLFGYDENNPWRFKFAIDAASVNLNDVSVTLGDQRDDTAWKEFVKSLSTQPKEMSAEKKTVPRWWKKAAFSLVAISVVLALISAIWILYLRPVPSVEVASVEKMAFPLPDIPSIAVLPFVNISDDPKQEYFSDGLTDQIINGLSKIPYLFVIARNSTFTYKGKPVKVQKVAEDLGVKYVLEGSVQKTPDRIRITAQLIDTITGHHIWSERYDRGREDIFAIQDDITMEIMKAMQVKLTRGDQARLWGKHETTNLKAYEKFQEARGYILRYTKENNAQGRELLEEAIALDSGFAGAYAFLGWTHFFDARFGWTEFPKKSAELAFKYAKKAIEMDDTLDYARTLLSAVYLVKRQHDKAVNEAERAVALNPNTAHSLAALAGVLGC